MERLVDARGLLCPLPLLRARSALASLGEADSLLVLATDREAPIDLAALATTATAPIVTRTRPTASKPIGFALAFSSEALLEIAAA